jgi:hypothetical protein
MRPNPAAPSLLSLHLLWLTALLTAMIALTGCGMGPRLIPSAQPGAAIQGNIHGGQQPVAGAHVYLFAAGTSGYGAASTSLLTSGDGSDSLGTYVLSDARGDFNLSGNYTCSPNQQVYALARGGDSGGGTNSAIGLMAILGSCPQAGNFSSIPFVEVNEVSTIAAAYSFAGYATDSVHVSSNGSPQALTGIANAFASASNLVDLGSGTALATTPAGNGTVPQATINTLANILASCVNSADLTVPVNGLYYSSACINLGLAVSGDNLNNFVGYTYDTATAAIFIAQNPQPNTYALWELPPASAPFFPILEDRPNDFSISIVFTGSGLTSPTATAVDASGNVWIADSNNTLDALTPLGAPITGSPFTDSSVSSPRFIAIDTSNNIWMSNSGSNSIDRFTNAGAFSFNTTFSYNAAGLSIDASGNAWIPNANGFNNGVLTSISPSGIATSVLTNLNFPQFSVLDSSGNLWFGSANTIGITEFNINTSTSSGPFTAGGMTSVGPLAVDSTGNLWGLMTSNANLLGIDASGNALPGTPYNNSGSNQASTFVFDGQNSFWLATSSLDFSSFPPVTTSYLTGVNNTGGTLINTVVPTPPSTSFIPMADTINALSVDSAGNIWVPAGNAVIEFIGIATPVETPMAQAVADSCIAQRPCLPIPPGTIARPHPIQP